MCAGCVPAGFWTHLERGWRLLGRPSVWMLNVTVMRQFELAGDGVQRPRRWSSVVASGVPGRRSHEAVAPGAVEVGVVTGAGDQLVGWAVLDDPAVGHDQHAVGDFDGGKPVCDDYGRPI